MKYLLVAVLLVGGCVKIPKKVDVDVEVSIEQCYTCFPSCEMTDATMPEYSCTTSVGKACAGCIVGCLGGKSLICGISGPECYNDLLDDQQRVPVICVGE